MPVDHIDDLRVYIQVVDSGTLAGAGRVLAMSPPLVSRRLARLEASLGVRLVERTTRSMHVTNEGRRFYAHCCRILAELETAQAELSPVSNEISGTVRAVLPTSMLAYGITDALEGLLDSHPHLNVHLRLSDQPVDLLAEGFDVATHIGIPADSSHASQLLATITPRLAATPEYLAHHGTPETPIDLAQHQCIRIATGEPQEHWPIVDTEGVTHRVPIGGRLTCHDVITLYTAMTSGLGIGLLPNAALTRAKADGILRQVLPGCRLESNTLYALMPKGRQRLLRVQAFVDWLGAFIKSLDD